MSNRIKLLPDHVANQIAAGEVVQRPASVVKELLENAVDAQASKIKLIVKNAGKSLIQVVDNGDGMSETDARLSLERHATSKISAAEDLFQLQTKGFRGEALASIAAIAHLELKTKQDQEDVGTQIQVEGSEVKEQQPIVTAKGTSIAVKNLFFNIPARRNFLKSDQVELKHIIDEFQRVALAHPNIAFDMIHNSNELFQLQTSNLRQRIVGIMGTKSNEKLVPVEESTDLLKVKGFIGKPEYAKRSRGEQFIFVNNRYIKDHYLNHAILAGFEGLLKDKTHPSYFLYLDIDPKRIDINIHPTKTEIKFDDQHAIYSIIQSSVKHSLGQFNIAPVLDFEKDSSLETNYKQHHSPAKIPSIEVDRDYNPFKTESTQSQSRQKSNSITNWEDLYSVEVPKTSTETVEFESKLFEEHEFTTQNKAFQLADKYLVSAFKSGLILINQHRAHYRILYEALLKNITEQPAASQQLLFPLELELNQKTALVFENLQESIENTGFRFSTSSKNHLVINGIPDLVQEQQVPQILDEIFSAFTDDLPSSSFESNTILAKALAKNMAIKTGVQLDQAEINQIIDTLFSCKDYLQTPDQKQIYFNLSLDDISKKFA
ncbi:DNA mismatch repair endonuclease MutL [Psychroflexus sp. ALD_RP9]|uniref:DNA mismatch repair endonuclease MutL n=1 Tax=Psychroflexus sp. ALD_RP9 TaxID=2777186 RepID=UPI001A8C88DE|nr:DNA mismatch repair endonuclease MutL [Psychroflexus sp. ALD_RP9]QSS97470.1 DNA mismatch repair endonuclease MutL [Psychroflexus sp. ALD_RP9]